jgi:NTP pyrophosphatase (non-canonical NTP hydrolase)
MVRQVDFNRYEEVFIDAADFWTRDSQLAQAMEECGELIAAINHWRRNRISSLRLASEIADVEIMCATLRHMIGDVIVDDALQKKLDRLQWRMSDGVDKWSGEHVDEEED